MQLNINLEFKETEESSDRAKKAQTKKAAAQYEPTWEEVWETGYTTHTGTQKKAIFKTKLTDPDREKLYEVKRAVEAGELGAGVDNMKKFSKSHALNLFKELKLIRREGIIKEMLASKPDNYNLINSEEDLDQMLELLDKEEIAALDTETTGVTYLDSTIGMSLSLDKADQHYYIPYNHITPEVQLSRELVMAKVKPSLERKGLKLILHNSKFDAHMLEKDGIRIRENIYFDTMIAMHVLNENEPRYALKLLANKYGKFFGYSDESLTFEELFSRDPKVFQEADILLAMIYACKDTHLTLMMYKFQLSMMEQQPKLKNVYFNIEQPNTLVALEMESNGFAIDFEFTDTYKKELTSQLKVLDQKLLDMWGEVNFNSPKQLATLFYEEMGYKDVSGKNSTDAATIKELAKLHPEVNILLEYRDINKLLSTYIEPLPKMVHTSGVSPTGLAVQGDGRLHGQFMQTGTVTGRWASKEPNLQNLPPKARKMVVAPKGSLLIGVDYKQIEPRVLASMSGDKGLQKPFIEGIDLYSTLASEIFNLEYEQCLESDDNTWRALGMAKHPRKLMKVGLLAVMYGISIHSLSGSLGISVDDAQKFMDDFYKTYPDMTRWMAEQVAFADKNGYTETADGRKRRFPNHIEVAKQYKALKDQIIGILGHMPPNIWDRSVPLPYKLKKQFGAVKGPYAKIERMSVNAVVQGSAADILKKAMVAVYYYLQDKEGWSLLGTIHDELLFQIPETATVEEIRALEAVMTNTSKLDIPIGCDTEIMTRWGEGIPLDEWVSKGMGRKAFKE